LVFLFWLALHWKGLEKLEQRPQSGPETPPLLVRQAWLLRGCAFGRNKEAKRHGVQECVGAASSLGAVPTRWGAGELPSALETRSSDDVNPWIPKEC